MRRGSENVQAIPDQLNLSAANIGSRVRAVSCICAAKTELSSQLPKVTEFIHGLRPPRVHRQHPQHARSKRSVPREGICPPLSACHFCSMRDWSRVLLHMHTTSKAPAAVATTLLHTAHLSAQARRPQCLDNTSRRRRQDHTADRSSHMERLFRTASDAPAHWTGVLGRQCYWRDVLRPDLHDQQRLRCCAV